MFSSYRHLKPVLWKKEIGDENAVYVDPYTSISLDHLHDVEKWEDHLSDLKSPEAVQISQKSNNMADQLIQLGHTKFQGHNFEEALNIYSAALCFAEQGTMFEGLAYGNRALCFFQLRMYQKALNDFDSATQKYCPEQFLADVQSSRVECQKLAKKHTEPKKSVPKLRVQADKKLPCMANW